MEDVKDANEEERVNFIFIFDSSRKNSINNCERLLLEKYIPKIDSISMNNKYEFIGDKGYVKRISYGFPFKIKPDAK